MKLTIPGGQSSATVKVEPVSDPVASGSRTVAAGTVTVAIAVAPAGTTVYVGANGNGKLDAGEQSTTTGTGGAYALSAVKPGSYTVRQVVPAGYEQASPSAIAGIAVTVKAGSALGGENFTDALAPAKLSGTTIGTPGSYRSDGNTVANATHGNLSAFFDAPTADGNWVGLDLGAAGGIVTEVKLASRSGFAGRMNGGTSQASDSPTFAAGDVTLYTVPANDNPPSSALTTATFANATAYRYYRDLSPDGSNGDLADCEVLG